jgi:hypothetical protein
LERAAIKVVQRMLNLDMGVALSTWRQRAADQRRLGRVAETVVFRWKNTTLATAFTTWNAQINEQLRLERAAVKVVQRMRNLSVGAAWGTWWHLVDEKRLQASQAVAQASVQTLEDEKTELLKQMQVELHCCKCCVRARGQVCVCMRMCVYVGMCACVCGARARVLIYNMLVILTTFCSPCLPSLKFMRQGDGSPTQFSFFWVDGMNINHCFEWPLERV